MTIQRRQFLKVLGAASGAAVAQGCSPAPTETLIPYLVAPETIVPGEAAFVATTCRECPAGCGMLVKTVDARAIKADAQAWGDFLQKADKKDSAVVQQPGFGERLLQLTGLR